MARPAIGGAFTLAIGVAASVFLSSASDFETRQLIEALLEILPFLGSAGIGGSASASALFAASIVLLLALAAPVGSEDAVERSKELLLVQYYATALLTAVVSGLGISMILMLQSAVSDLVRVLGFGEHDHHALVAE